jgi:hypothetical protein
LQLALAEPLGEGFFVGVRPMTKIRFTNRCIVEVRTKVEPRAIVTSTRRIAGTLHLRLA